MITRENIFFGTKFFVTHDLVISIDSIFIGLAVLVTYYMTVDNVLNVLRYIWADRGYHSEK